MLTLATRRVAPNRRDNLMSFIQYVAIFAVIIAALSLADRKAAN